MKPGILTSRRADRQRSPHIFLGLICLALLPAVIGTSQSAASPETGGTNMAIPFEFSRGRIMVPVRASGSAPMSFMLDTGYSLAMISPDRAEALQLKRVGEVTVAGI